MKLRSRNQDLDDENYDLQQRAQKLERAGGMANLRNVLNMLMYVNYVNLEKRKAAAATARVNTARESKLKRELALKVRRGSEGGEGCTAVMCADCEGLA